MKNKIEQHKKDTLNEFEKSLLNKEGSSNVSFFASNFFKNFLENIIVSLTDIEIIYIHQVNY